MPAQTAPNRQKKRQQPGQRPSGMPLNVFFFIALLFVIVFFVLMTQPGIRMALGIPIIHGADGAAARTGLRVTEVMASNGSALPDDRGQFSDWIELCNLGESDENLAGIGLSDDASRVRFVFPEITLAPGECLLVYASGIAQADASAPLHTPFKLSAAGETLYLFDAQGTVIEQIDIPSLARDEAYARTGDAFAKTAEHTAGYPNTQAGREAFLAARIVDQTPLQLNELMASNRSNLMDADGDYVDWIELHNRGEAAVDLSQYALSDDPSNPLAWRFPAGAVIEPHGYYVVYASGKDLANPNAPHTSFGLRAEGETVLLSNLLGQVLDSTTYDNLKSDTVWVRPRDWVSWTVTDTPTPGAPNP